MYKVMAIVLIILLVSFGIIFLLGDTSTEYQYTIEVKDCNGEKDTLVIRGSDNEEFHIATHEQAVPLLKNVWGTTVAINICKYRIISKCKLSE